MLDPGVTRRKGASSLACIAALLCAGCNAATANDDAAGSGGSSASGGGGDGGDGGSGGTSGSGGAGGGGGSGASSGTGGSCATGEEDCECYANQTCSGSLSCSSNRCVALGTGGEAGSGGTGGSGGDGSGGDPSASGSGGSGGAECAADQFGPDCEPCLCEQGVCDEGLQGSGDCTCDPGWVGNACDERPRSCNALLVAFPSAATGSHVIDPDGAEGSLEPFEAFCDMEFDDGGWTLIMGSNALGTDDQTAGIVAPGSGRYMPSVNLLALAADGISSQIHIRARDAAETESITSTPNSLPLTNLRALALLNDNSGMYSASDEVVDWTGPFADIDHLWHNCAAEPFETITGYPSLWWSCGNGTGLHINPTRSGWNSSVSIDMEVYLR